MSDKTCLICRRDHAEETCEIFTLAAWQEALLLKNGAILPDEFVYCSKCWTLMSHPQIAPKLMRDAAERQMLKGGLTPVKARQMADKFFTRLVELQRERHHKTH